MYIHGSFFLFRLAVPETLSIVHFMICASLGELQNKQQKKKGHQPPGVSSPSDTASDSGLTLGLTDSSNQVLQLLVYMYDVHVHIFIKTTSL